MQISIHPLLLIARVSSLVLKFFFLGGVRWELLINKYINYEKNR